MATPGVMKLLEEKNVDKGISHFVWSPKMDIIAVASEQNDTSLYRLNFQKVSLKTGLNFQKVSLRIVPTFNIQYILIALDLDNRILRR